MRIAQEIKLGTNEKALLVKLSSSRLSSVRMVERAKIILMAAESNENIEIARVLNITRQKVARWRLRYIEDGLKGIEKDAPRPGRKLKYGKSVIDEVVRKTLDEKPADGTHWSRSTMAKVTGLSDSTIGRIWKENGLKPHLTAKFKMSNDPDFIEKLEDIVGLYLSPPEHAIVLSCDEKSQIQALDRTQPGLPLIKGRCGTMTHDYTRHGTTSLFAAMNIADGKIISTCMKQHRHQEWLKFLNKVKNEVPDGKEVHIICDNYATHKHAKVKAWQKRNKLFHFHFTPTSASWLNMIERFFRDITENRLKRGVFRSVEELTKAIEDYIELYPSPVNGQII